MKTKLIVFIFAGLFLTTACMQKHSVELKYPKAKKVDTVDVYFGHRVADPYRWLEDDRAEDTHRWVEAENKLTFDFLSKIPFRKALHQHLEELWNYPKFGVPFQKGGRLFYFENSGMQNQSVLYMQRQINMPAEMLLDPNKLSDDGTVALTGLGISKNGKYLAYSVASSGSDWNEIHVMEIDSKTQLSDHIKWVKFSGISWYGDGFFYSSYDKPLSGDELSQQNRFHKIYYHHLGQSQEKDRLIFQNHDFPLRNYYAYTTSDEQFLIVSETESTSGNALYAAHLNGSLPVKFVKIAEGFKNDFTVVGHLGNRLLVLTNQEAPFYKLIGVDYTHPSYHQTIISEKKTEREVLQSVELAGDRIFAQYLKDAGSRACFYDYQGHYLSELSLPGIGTLSGFNGEKNNFTAYYGFTSFTNPGSIFKLDLKSGKTEVYKKVSLKFDPDAFETKQVFYKSKDGTRVPMFITYKKGLKRNGKNPTLLYAYGGFNISLTPGFSVSRMAFLEQGGIYAMANLRGGGEYGEAWHQAGTKMHKQHVFDDFIAAAHYLIDEKYTSSEKLAIMGGSNGGLLIGACMTQQPHLFKVAIPMVGVMDMLRYHKFTIGWAWASDYGRSDDSEEMFKYLYAYSPLHNIHKGEVYPATLALTADHDDRVVPAHTFKFMATLQAKASPKHPALLRVETKAGHGAGKPTSKQLDEATDIYSFIMFELGMSPKLK